MLDIAPGLRQLDFDDLILLGLLVDGLSLTAAAKALRISQPAATQRLHKIEHSVGASVVEKVGRSLKLTPQGTAICERAKAALNLWQDIGNDSKLLILNIGSRPEVGASWLWPTLEQLRKKVANTTYHCHLGGGAEILRLLGIGELDAVLTSAPVTVRDFQAIELAREDYLLCAKQETARGIACIQDLEKHVLIEHDRSFPFLRYVPAVDRGKLRFLDVWFTGSTELMVKAIVSGFGVGFIPSYLANPYLQENRLSRVDLGLKLDHDWFRLLYRQTTGEQNIAIHKLAEALKKTGLQV